MRNELWKSHIKPKIMNENIKDPLILRDNGEIIKNSD
jgi:hypothetical protein